MERNRKWECRGCLHSLVKYVFDLEVRSASPDWDMILSFQHNLVPFDFFANVCNRFP
jgi:hypothetical protein